MIQQSKIWRLWLRLMVLPLVISLIDMAVTLRYQPPGYWSGDRSQLIEANPLVTPPHIVPEWYFLPFYAILRSIPDKLLGVVAMFGSIVLVALMPWLDTSKVRSAVYRPLYKQVVIIFALVTIGLGYLGAMPPEGGYLDASRNLAAMYCAFCITLPVLGLIEKTKPLPPSIADSVLGEAAISAQAQTMKSA